jgi:hypothetical protein
MHQRDTASRRAGACFWLGPDGVRGALLRRPPQGGPDRWIVVGCDGGAIGTVLLGWGKQERHNIATVCDHPTTSKNMVVVLIAGMLRDRHSAPTRAAVIPSLSCRRCSPNPPFAKLESLTAEQP